MESVLSTHVLRESLGLRKGCKRETKPTTSKSNLTVKKKSFVLLYEVVKFLQDLCKLLTFTKISDLMFQPILISIHIKLYRTMD